MRLKARGAKMPSTQALRLQEMMKRQQRLPDYTLSLYPVEVKKRSFERLEKGDLVLLESKRLTLYLCRDETIDASCSVISQDGLRKIEVTDLIKKPEKKSDSKKYKILFPVLAQLPGRKIEPGTVIDISDIDISQVTLLHEGKSIAAGHLVIFEDEIAIMIDSCHDKGKK